MPKKLKKRYELQKRYSFPVLKVFPASDQIGLDLLRLMAAYNDMQRIAEWMNAHQGPSPVDPIAKEIAKGRLSMQYRLMISYLHEAFEVIKQMEQLPNFQGIEDRLDQEGKEALDTLRRMKRSQIFSQIEHIRSKATFHYLRSYFAKVLREFRGSFEKPDKPVESVVIFRGSGESIETYYSLPDQLRNEISFGITPRENTRELLEQMMVVRRKLILFLNSALVAYMTGRGLAGEFKKQ
ncbi:MAG: hypothetical protein HY208_02450 [Nitrospirae bacterium]|nr:hypothetical protein [Nitrospirota bacterium]